MFTRTHAHRRFTRHYQVGASEMFYLPMERDHTRHALPVRTPWLRLVYSADKAL